MLICAFCATPVIGLLWVHSLWPAVSLIGIAAAAHQGWSANLYTLVSDLFPRREVASVVGIGGLAGALGGTLAAPGIGYWLGFSRDSYGPLFVIAGSAYLLAFCVIQLLTPKLEPARII